MVSGIVYQPFIEMLLALYWENAYEHGVPLYTPASYRIAYLSLIVALLFAVIAALFIQEACPERE